MKNDPCLCGSGKKHRQCCWLKRFDGGISGPALLGDTTLPLRPWHNPPIQTKVRVRIEYTFSDGLGTGQVEYAFEESRKFLLTNGFIVPAAKVDEGMRFYLDDGMVATVTRAEPPKVWNPPPLNKDRDGNSVKCIVGTVKYTGHYPIMDLVVNSDLHLRTTPGHLFYSVDRGGWVNAGSLTCGEAMQDRQGQTVFVTRVSAPRFETIDLYNVEVEDHHTYYVGRSGETTVWSHNGLDMQIGCSIPKPMQPGLFDDVPDHIGYGVRSLRPNQYNIHAIPQSQVIRSQERIRAVIGDSLKAEGTYSDPISGLYSFVRQGGGAGYQGVTKNPLDRTRVVIANFETSDGCVLAAIDITKISSDKLYDFGDPTVSGAFLAQYPTYTRLVARMAAEGVVAVRGDIPVVAVTGLVRIPKSSSRDAIRASLLALFGGQQ